MCALRLARKYNNNGPSSDDILYDLPILWFDQEWWGGICQHAKEPINCTRWHHVASNFYAMHTRYPKNPEVPKNSATDRSMQIINRFFDVKCAHTGCLPLHGADLIAYEGMADVTRSRTAGKMQLKQRARGCYDLE